MIIKKNYKKRIVEEKIDKIINNDFAIYIIGPKWCGKTTTALRYCNSYIDFQDEFKKDLYQRLAKDDINLLLEGEKPRLIDEWQEIKKVWNMVKRHVDFSTSHHVDYFLTGSTTPPSMEGIDSGAGRFIRIVMSTMSLYELGESTGEVSLKSLFNPETKLEIKSKELSIQKLAYYICRGGWPKILETNQDSHLIIAKSFFDQLVFFDVSKFDGVKRNPILASTILKSYARNISTVDKKNQKNIVIYNDIKTEFEGKVSDSTIIDYINVFKSLFIIYELYAWSPNIRSATKIRTGKKKLFIDTSIATAALGISPEELVLDPHTMGFFFENFVAHELGVYLQDDGHLEHYRDDYGLECDFVIRYKAGKYALCQVKLSANNIDSAISAMEKICDLLIEHNNKNENYKYSLPTSLIVIVGTSPFAFTTYSKHKIPIHIVPINTLKP